MIWSNEILDRFVKEAEDHLVNDFPCLIDRLALDITSGTSEYTLPDYVTNIRRITWQGRKLDPMPHRQMREVFQPLTQTGKPYWYIFNNVGLLKIKFFPIPAENFTADQTNLFGSAIPDQVIVEFYRASDFDEFTIPTIVKRRTLKAYVLSKCFAIESKGQDLKIAKYYADKFEQLKINFRDVLDELIYLPRKYVMASSYLDNIAYPSQPLLPIDKFGISVDTGS